jgi:hypothetical protein
MAPRTPRVSAGARNAAGYLRMIVKISPKEMERKPKGIGKPVGMAPMMKGFDSKRG